MSQLISQLLPSKEMSDSSKIASDTTLILITYFMMVAVVVITCVVLICAVSVNLIKKYNNLKSN